MINAIKSFIEVDRQNIRVLFLGLSKINNISQKNKPITDISALEGILHRFIEQFGGNELQNNVSFSESPICSF